MIFFQDFRSSIIASLKTGKSIRLQGMSLSPKPTEVALVTEKITSTFTINVYADALSDAKKIVFTHSYDIDIMPYDQWLGTSILPQMSCFVCYAQSSAVNNIIAKAASKLRKCRGLLHLQHIRQVIQMRYESRWLLCMVHFMLRVLYTVLLQHRMKLLDNVLHCLTKSWLLRSGTA